MKKCSRCKEIFPLENFGKDRGSKDGKGYYCKPCAKDISRESRLKYGPAKKLYADRKWRWKTEYGLTVEQVEMLLQEQEHVCAICKRLCLRCM